MQNSLYTVIIKLFTAKNQQSNILHPTTEKWQKKYSETFSVLHICVLKPFKLI